MNEDGLGLPMNRGDFFYWWLKIVCAWWETWVNLF